MPEENGKLESDPQNKAQNDKNNEKAPAITNSKKPEGYH